MTRFKPYGFVESKYPLWLERDLRWAYKDQLKMAIILVLMMLGLADVFLYFKFQFGLVFWIGSLITVLAFSLGLLPLWSYTKKWIKGMEGTFYLRANATDSDYKFLKEKITTILNEANFKHRITELGFQSELSTAWQPEEDIIKFAGQVKIVELTFDIADEEGLAITMNSLSMFPGMEDRLISKLSEYFSMNHEGIITAKI